MNDRIKNDLTEAMKSQDKFKTSVLRMLKTELQKEKINKKDELSDSEIMAIIKKQVKVRNSSIEEYKKYNKLEEVKNLEKEIEILNSYLPADLTMDELNNIINNVFDELKPIDMKDMGKVISSVKNIVGPCADMGLVSKIVKDRLNKK